MTPLPTITPRGTRRWRRALSIELIALLTTAATAWGQTPGGEPPVERDPAEASDEEVASFEAELEGPALDPAPSSGIEEIVVTSSGFSESLIDTPNSVTAFDADYLEALNVQDIGDLTQATPNFEIKRTGTSAGALFIRGVGLDDTRVNAASAVAVLYDDVYRNSAAGQLSQIFDVSNVDVLRGPQGALYGRNATAGAIRILSNLPTGEFGGEIDISYGRFNHIETEGYLQAPLIPDLLATRGAFKVRKRDGFGRNRCADPNPDRGTLCNAGGDVFSGPFRDLSRPEEKVNDADEWAARLILRLTPQSYDTDWNLNLHGGRNRGLAPSGQKIGLIAEEGPLITFGVTWDDNTYYDKDLVKRCPAIIASGQCRANPRGTFRNPADPILRFRPEDGDPYAGDYNRTGDEAVDSWGATLSGSSTLANWQLRNITGYEQIERKISFDADASPFAALESETRDVTWQFTQELRASWEDEYTRLLVGANYLHESLRADNIFRTVPFDSTTQSGFVLRGGIGQRIDQTTDYLGAYATLAFDISPDFTLEGGVRLNWEYKDFEVVGVPQRDPDGVGGPRTPPGIVNRSSDEGTIAEPSGELKVHWRPTESFATYLKYTRAVKGQHFNGGATSPSALIRPAEPEFVNAIETGWKTRWWDERIHFNGAVFYYNYENLQVFQVQNGRGQAPIDQLINAEDTRVFGLEADVDLEYEGLRLFTSVGYLFSEYTDFTNIVETVTFDVNSQTFNSKFDIEDFSGNQLVSSPELSITGFALYRWEMGGAGSLTPRLDYSWRDDVFYTPRNAEQLGDDDLLLLHLRITYATPAETIELTGWVRNLTDEAYPVTAFDFERNNESYVYLMGAPRTYGVSLKVRF